MCRLLERLDAAVLVGMIHGFVAFGAMGGIAGVLRCDG